jgi:hypothetical protein
MRLQIVPNASSIRFRYLDFSMADVVQFLCSWLTCIILCLEDALSSSPSMQRNCTV